MKITGIVTGLLIFIWVIWASFGYTYEAPKSKQLENLTLKTIQLDSVKNANVIAIQPEMRTQDYASEAHFYQKIEQYFLLAKENNWIQKNTVVLLPEYLGTWLVVNQEKQSVMEAATLTSAMMQMVLSNPLKMIKFYRQQQGENDKIAASIFRMKSESMARIYGNVFKKLAKQYQVQIVAGSIVLPSPKVINNEIQIDTSALLYNVSFLFDKEGKINPISVKKVFPIDSELPFIASSAVKELPVFTSGNGNIGVLVCADSWYPETYQELKKKHVEVVLVPSFCAGNGTMNVLWQGYNGRKMPGDVDKRDIGRLTEQQAWEKYALPGRLAHSGARLGINVFLSGQLWDLGSDGGPFFVYGNQVLAEKESHGIWSINY